MGPISSNQGQGLGPKVWHQKMLVLVVADSATCPAFLHNLLKLCHVIPWQWHMGRLDYRSLLLNDWPALLTKPDANRNVKTLYCDRESWWHFFNGSSEALSKQICNWYAVAKQNVFDITHERRSAHYDLVSPNDILESTLYLLRYMYRLHIF